MKTLRFITAGVGGYILASLLTVSLTLILTFNSHVESIILATMLSFTFWLIFILYSFSDVDIKKILLQLLIVCIILFAFNTYFMPVRA